MRTIRKRNEPASLTRWRAANQADSAETGINYGYDLLRQDRNVSADLIAALVAEQGGLCAYTGRRVDASSSHVEHLLPQAYCARGEDVAYDNLVACWPKPNGPRCEYGAHYKDSWPVRIELALFVSPLKADAETRFAFNHHGEISASNPADQAAATTIKKLGLDLKLPTNLRGQAIEGVLGRYRDLKLDAARRRLRQLTDAEAALDAGGRISLEPYCFALKQALQKHIRRLENAKRYAG